MSQDRSIDDMILNINTSKKIKQQAHLYDVNNNPKILPEKYAVSKAELFNLELSYNHTPDSCADIVEKANLPLTP